MQGAIGASFLLITPLSTGLSTLHGNFLPETVLTALKLRTPLVLAYADSWLASFKAQPETQDLANKIDRQKTDGLMGQQAPFDA